MKFLSTLILATVCVAGFSQKKPKINQALIAMEKGDYAKAKSIIDAAIEHEKTKNNAKTWYYRGQIYATLDTTNNELEDRKEAIKSFNKSLEIDPQQKTTSSITTFGVENVDSKIHDYYSHFYNKAVIAYTAEKFNSAADNFEIAFYINPKDTNAIMNAALAAALETENDERAKNNFMKAYTAGVRNILVFFQLYNFAIKEERLEDGLDIVRKGRTVYPNDKDLAKFELNLLIQLDKTEEAIEELKKKINDEPTNPEFHFSLGVLLEELENYDDAMKSYYKAIEIDPNHYNSNFNIGVALFNESNKLIKEKNELSYKETEKNKKLTKQVNGKLKKLLPYWEKLYSINSEDITVLETLSYIYINLNMNDKWNEIQTKLDALTDK